MQKALRVRSNVLHKMRRFLVEDCSFVEVETPTLFGKTPGVGKIGKSPDLLFFLTIHMFYLFSF